MKTISRVLMVAAVVASLACISVMARDTPNAPPKTPGACYTKAYIWAGVTGQIVPLPRASEPGGERGSVGNGPSEQGPLLAQMASTNAGKMLGPQLGGSAIPSVGGGVFMTPMQKTDQQIKQLIKKLG